jgi:aspartyl-tRNA(Asn)/glutamyl-tRNA(Gln) amidotransferase subunit B
VPDPSRSVIRIDAAWLAAIQKQLPEMPSRKAQRFTAVYRLSAQEASAMSQERDVAEFFEAAVNRMWPRAKRRLDYLPPDAGACGIAIRPLARPF